MTLSIVLTWQSPYNVTLGCVRLTVVAVENQLVMHIVCVCSTRHPGCNAHALFCHLWPVPLYNIFPHYFINGRTFGKKSYWMQNVCFGFLYNICLKHFSFWEELCEIWKKIYIVSHSCPILMKNEFYVQFFEKYSNIKFRGKPSDGSRVVPFWQTDWQAWRS